MWFASLSFFINKATIKKLAEWLQNGLFACGLKGLDKQSCLTKVSFTIWHISKERNGAVFEKKLPSPDDVLRKIRRDVDGQLIIP